MKRYIVYFILFKLTFTSLTLAEVRFDPVFTDNMVIQQGMPIRIFGTESVQDSKIKISLGDKSVNVVPDETGYWEAVFRPMKGGFERYTIQSEVKYNREKIYREIKNVYIGDVWLCAGQNNMDAPISKFPSVQSSLSEVSNNGLRFAVIRKGLSATPSDVLKYDHATEQKWQPCWPNRFLWEFSAMAYFFGDKVSYKTKVPVGVVEVTLNAPIEAWIPKEEYLAAGFNEKTVKNRNGSTSPESSSVVYNGMVHPLTKMNVKGILWSHGHANSLRPMVYEKQLKTLISSWRKRFNNPELPFFVAQTAPHKGNSTDKSGESLAWLREAQAKVLSIPNTGLVVLTDAGEYTDAVTQDQRKAGERFALWAQKLNRKSIRAMGPTIKKATPQNNSLVLEFSNVEKGLKTARVVLNKAPGKDPGTDPGAAIAEEKEVRGFQIAGKNGVFHPATAKISGSRIQLSSKAVRHPIYARYAWSNFPVVNVFNSYDIPMVPFRTDRLPPPSFDGSFSTSAVNLTTASGEQMELIVSENYKTRTENIGDGRGILFKKVKRDISALFSIDAAEFQRGNSPKTEVTVVFFDKDPGYLTINYDSSEESNKGSKLAGKIKMAGTNKWKYAKFSVDDAFFGKRLSGADLMISTTNSDIILSGVFLDKVK